MRTAYAAVAAALVAAAAAGAADGPGVSLVRAAPVVVSGHGYRGSSKVVVAYRSGSVYVRRTVTTSARGGFLVTLRGISFDRCDGLTLVAGTARLSVRACTAGGRPGLSADPGGLVVGTSFVPGEHVVVQARPSAGAAVSAAATANASGRFTIRMPVPRTACAEVSYRASGSLGSQAVYGAPAPDCVAP